MDIGFIFFTSVDLDQVVSCDNFFLYFAFVFLDPQVCVSSKNIGLGKRFGSSCMIFSQSVSKSCFMELFM